MLESKFRAEIGRMLRRNFYWAIASQNAQRCPSCGTPIKPKVVGRPDLLCLNPAEPSISVECKVFTHKAGDKWSHASFSLSRITPQQRLWLTNFQDDADARHPNGWTASYIAICTSHGRAGSAKSPRLAWLSPWKVWLEMEREVLKVRKSLPLVALRKGDEGLGAMDILPEWTRLIWERGGWAVSIDHPLWLAELRDLDEFSAKWSKE